MPLPYLDAKLTASKELSIEAVNGVVGIPLVHEPYERESPRLATAKVPGHVYITKLTVPNMTNNMKHEAQ